MRMRSKSITSKLNFLFAFLGSALLLIGIYSYFKLTKDKISINTTLIILFITLVIVVLAVRINRKSTKFFLLGLSVISFIVYIIWNLYARTIPTSDYEVLLDGANKIINGTFNQYSFDKTNYFYFYNFQIGYTAYLALVSKVFGGKLIFFKIFEWIYLIVTSIMIYKICEDIYTKDIGAIAATLYSLYIPNVMGSSVINNQHISGVLMVTSLYFMLKNNKRSAAIGGVFLGLMQIFRPMAIIFIIGIAITYVCKVFSKTRYLEILGILAIYILCFAMVVKLFDIGFVKAEIAPKAISQSNAKYFKFVLGLTGEGVYKIPTESARKTQVYFDLQKTDFDYDAYNKECLTVIKESIKNHKETFTFLKNKMYKFLGNKDNQYDFALTNEKTTDYIFKLSEIGNLQYLFLIIGALMTLIGRFKRNNKEIDILCLLFIGFALVHVFIETQTRYRYEMYIMLVILAAEFIAKFMKKTKSVL